MSKILSSPREDKIDILKPPCNAFLRHKHVFFSFNKDKNWFAAFTKVAISKTKLLAGNIT